MAKSSKDASCEGVGVLLLTDADSVRSEPKNHHWLQISAASLRHPLALVLVSSLLIPFVIYLLQAHNASVDGRQKKALAIVTKNAEFEGQLDSIYADLSFFNVRKQTLLQPPKPTESSDAMKQNQDKLRDEQDKSEKEFANRYTEFSKSYSNQNLWVDDLVIEGVILGLFSANDIRNQNSKPNLVKLRNDIEMYRKNVVDSKSVLARYHKVLFEDEAYDPTKISGNWITGTYNRLHDERKLIVDELVRDFLP
jgi:hypothetical protein